eukprot:m.232316 g.232316  ORF g.232316 m.232316 type:complete len:82 (-) comp33619_c1_seq3:1631-1876(-)
MGAKNNLSNRGSQLDNYRRNTGNQNRRETKKIEKRELNKKGEQEQIQSEGIQDFVWITATLIVSLGALYGLLYYTLNSESA